jgi:hypothetical protein
VGDLSSIAGHQAVPVVVQPVPAASLHVLRKVKAPRGNSPAGLDPSIPRAPHPAVSPAQVDPVVRAVVLVLALVQVSAALRVPDSARGPDSVALPAPLRLLESHRAHNAPAMPAAAAAANNIPRRRKAR